MSSASFLRTRLAPTPSGYLHLGNAASFLITSALARKTGARVLLRIDDLDRNRVRPEYVQDVFDTLHWLNLPWDEGPSNVAEFESSFSQLYRRDLYASALDLLRIKGAVFACTCSRSQLAAQDATGYPGTCLHKEIPLDTPGASWRIRTPENAVVMLKDISGVTQTLRIPPSVQHAIVRKKDGEAAYHLSSVVDDLHHGVDLIVRGQDLFDSTLVQLYIASMMDEPRFGSISFHHHPLLTDAEGRKMSKSDGATSIRAMRKAGMTAEEVAERAMRIRTPLE